MKIEKNKKMLLVRYSDFLYKDCIDDHIEVINQNGFCWFGKVGKQKPSKKFCDVVLSEEYPMIILHSAKKAYICDVEEIIFDTPQDGCFPKYYKSVLFDKGNEPSAYFKISSCIEINKSVLSNFIVSSSRNSLPNSLHGSMNSIFLIECDKTVQEKELYK